MTSTGIRRNSSSASAPRSRARSSRPGSRRPRASSRRPIRRIRPIRNGRRSRDEGLERLDGQIQPAHRQERLLRALWLQYRFRGGAVAQAMRRRSHAREHHEAGVHISTWSCRCCCRASPEDAARPTCARSSRCGWCVSMASATCCSATCSRAIKPQRLRQRATFRRPFRLIFCRDRICWGCVRDARGYRR